MSATKINLSQMVDLAVGTPEVCAVNCNVLHTLLHAMLRQLNIVDVQADLNNFNRDVLSASKARELSVLSDVDGGRGDDAEDAHSESPSSMPARNTGKRTPVQLLEVKVAKLQEEVRRITPVSPNKHLLKKARTKYDDGEMQLKMQLMNRVETNEKEIAKLNIDDLMKRLNAMEKSMNEMNDGFSTLPYPDDFAKFVTQAGLEDALQGIRQDCGNLQQPTERVVIKMSSQTDPVPSRPSTSRSVTRSEKKLVKLGESHEALTRRVEELEAKMRNKLDQGALDGLNVSSELLEQLQEMKEQVDALAAARKQDLDDLLRSQNANRVDIKKLVTYCDELKHNKADRAEVREKADNNKMALLAISSLIERKNNYILDRMAVNEDNWNEQCQIFSDDISEKLDREPLKEALNKLKKENQAPVEWVDDDAAGIRRPVLPSVPSVSNHQALPPSRLPRPQLTVKMDQIQQQTKRPVQPSVSNRQALPPSRLPRPQLTVKMDQIQQQTKSDISTSTSITGSRSQYNVNFDRAVAERQKVKMCQSDQRAFQVHFGNDVEALQKQRNNSNDFANADNNATNRSCGEQHNTTNPHKRLSKLPVYSMTKLSHLSLSNTIIKEDVETNAYPVYKEEVDAQGADGNIYKGRMVRVETKLPPVTQATQDPSSMQRKDKNPQQMRRKVMWVAKPSSDTMLYAPRPPPKNGSCQH